MIKKQIFLEQLAMSLGIYVKNLICAREDLMLATDVISLYILNLA